MKAFKHFWSDIRQGNNIDLYLAAPTAFVVVALSFLGIANDSIILSVLLAISGVLTISALYNRHAISELKTNPSVNNIFLEEFPPELNRQVEAASRLMADGRSVN